MTDLPKISELYADGGVIGANPSEVGGTWAFCIVHKGLRIVERAQVITPSVAQMQTVTNNLTEMMAVVMGLKMLPADWRGTVYSDSRVTLGRVFEQWQWKNIPMWLHREYQEARGHLINWERIKWVNLQGHPTKAELFAGFGRKGLPVSEHNVWCDLACGEVGRPIMNGKQPVSILRCNGRDWCGRIHSSIKTYHCPTCHGGNSHCSDCGGTGKIRDICCDYHGQEG